MAQGIEESGTFEPDDTTGIDTPRPRRRTRRAGSDRVRRGSRWVSRVLLLLAVTVAVLWQGGVSVEAVLAVTGLTALAWVAAWPAPPHKTPRSRLAGLWLVMGLWTALQVVPLPHALVAWLHPQTAAIVDAGRRAIGLTVGGWLPLAVAPGDAALQGALYLVAAALSLLAGIVLMGENSRQVARGAALTILGLTCISGIAWACAWLGPVSEMLPPSLSALLRNLAFVNPNNQAGLLNVGFALAVGRVGQGGSTRQQTLFGLIATALALLVLFVGSRGGYLTLLAVLAMTAAAMPRPPRYLRRDERDRQLSAIRSVGSVVLVILVLGALLALPMIEKELQPTQLHDEKLQQMARMFSLVRGAWPVGAGPGSLPVLGGMDVLFGRYRHDFAENLLLERALDQGLIFTLGFTVALVLMLRRMVRRWDGMTAVPSIVVAITALLMANLVDFSLEMAGGLVPMLALAACAERQLPAPSVRESGRRLFHGRRAVMAWSGLALTAAAWLLTVAVPGVTRRVPDALAGQKPAQAKAIVARHFVHDQHAFYLLGRLLLDEGDTHGGMRALDRAVALRPDSKHAHLFRFAARVEAGDTQGAMADLRWLLHSDGDTFSRTLQLCARSTRGEAVLVAAIPDLTDLSYSIGLEYEHTRPDLLERLALALRDKFPDKRFGIEAVRGHLYVKRGMMEPARHIATAMLVEPTTRDQGWQLEADIQAHTGHPLEAFHLLADLCNRHPTDFNVCQYAMQAGLAATKPVMVLAFLEKHRELMMESPSQAAAYWYGYGSAKSMLNDDDEAVQAARTAHGLMPEDIDTALLLAHSLGRIGQHEEERDLLSHLKESHPNDARVLALWKQVEQVLSPLAGLVPDAPSVASPTAATRTQ